MLRLFASYSQVSFGVIAIVYKMLLSDKFDQIHDARKAIKGVLFKAVMASSLRVAKVNYL